MAVATAPALQTASVKAPSGYKAKTRDGITVYCKNSAKLGTRFKTETCLTAEQITLLDRQSDRDRDQLTKAQTVCGAGCGHTN
jgi:hypothetical protein